MQQLTLFSAKELLLHLSNRKTPTSTSGSGTPGSASVTIVSSGEYRRSRYPQRNTYRRRIEYRQAAFPVETLSGEGGRVHPTARKYFVCGSAPSA